MPPKFQGTKVTKLYSLEEHAPPHIQRDSQEMSISLEEHNR